MAAVVVALGFASGCSFAGCGLEPLPAGFPPAERHPNAVQVRLTQTGVDAIEAEPARFVGLLGPVLDGGLQLPVSPSCGSNPAVCCPGGVPSSSCGPLTFDVTAAPGDLPRLALVPAQGASRVDATLRARVWSVADLPVYLPTVGDCGLRIDSRAGSFADLRIDVPLSFVQDATAGTTRVVAGAISVSQLENGDFALTGGFGCLAASYGTGFLTASLADTLADQINAAIARRACKPCPTGDVAGCGAFATACLDGVCMENSACLQELGIAGRAHAATLLPRSSPASLGAIDVHQVAGGYATTNSAGAAFGMLGGLLPAGLPRDRCGPPAIAPGPATIPPSSYFQGNVRPDTGAPFALGFGVHRSQLEDFAYAAYEGGLLCMTTAGTGASALSTEDLAAVAPSLRNLLADPAPLTVGWRPQGPPSITLGHNTFDGGSLTEPALDVRFSGMQIDLFAELDGQEVRVLTAVADVHLPIGLVPAGLGRLEVVSPEAVDAFTNVSVQGSEALLEPPAALASSLSGVLGRARVQLAEGFAPIALPSLAGLELDVREVTGLEPDSVTGEPSFVALFAELAAPDGGASLPARGAPGGPGGSLEWIAPTTRAPGAQGSVDPRGPGTSPAGRPMLAALLLGFVAIVWISARRRESGARGAAVRVLVAAGMALLALGSSCQCGGTPPGPDGGQDAGSPCGAGGCAAGEVAPGGLGRWTSLAADPNRVLAATYDQDLGDLVVVDVTDPNARRITPVDGIPPGTRPTYEPSTYRRGILEPGPDVGAWTSVALWGGKAVVAYQDRSANALKLAFEGADGGWTTTLVDDGGGAEAGQYASLVVDDAGRPAVAYVVIGVADASGLRLTQLRIARASSAQPGAGDWSSSLVASVAGSCAGRCGGSEVCVADGPDERCRPTSQDCAVACTAGEACVAGSCTAVIAPPAVTPGAHGTGLYVSLVVLPDGRLAAAYYDAEARALKLAVESAAGSGTYVESTLDGRPGGDHGRWSSAAVDEAGVIHVAYQDAIGKQLLYTTWSGAPGTPEVVDDGQRSGDRPHPVGASAFIFLASGTPTIVYQDGHTADVYVAARDGGWQSGALAPGPLLDGFSLSAAMHQGTRYVAWRRLDPSQPEPSSLVIERP